MRNFYGYTSENTLQDIVALGNDLRFSYEAVSTAGGNASVGNFLDLVSFGLESEVIGGGSGSPVPAPAEVWLIGIGLTGMRKKFIALRS